MAKDVIIKIKGDSKDYQASLKSIEKGNSKLGVSAAAVAGGMTVAFAAIAASVVKVTQAYAVQEQAEIRTRQTLKATGYAAGLTADELFNMASGLQEVTTFGDEAILGGQNLLLTFRNIGGDVFPRATKAMLDMSTAMGTGLKESAIQLGKALNDPRVGITALTRVGITFTDQQKEQIKTMQSSGDMAGAQSIILKELEMQFGGVAEAAKAGTGVFTQLGNTWGDIAEKLGKKLLPVTSYWARQMKDLGKAIDGSLGDEPRKNIDALEKSMAAVQKKIDDIKISNAKPIVLFKKSTKDLEDEFTLLELDLIAQKAAIAKSEKDKADIKQAARDKELAARKQVASQSLELLQSEFDAEKELMEQESIGEATLENLALQLENEKIIKEDARVQELEAQGKHKEALQLQEDLFAKRSLATAQKTAALELKQKQDFYSTAISLSNSNNSALAAIGKAAALTQLAIKTPEAVANSYAFGTKTGGPILGSIFSGIAYAAMAAQAAQIAGISGFEQGGVVGGFSGATAGGDNTLITARNGEMMLNAEQQRNVFDMISNGQANNQNGSESVEISLNLNDNLIDFVEAEVVRRRAIGVSAI